MTSVRILMQMAAQDDLVLHQMDVKTAYLHAPMDYAFLWYELSTCVFTSSERPDIEFIRSLYFNTIEFMRFNSTAGKWVGYDHHGIYNAERLNNDPVEMAEMRSQKERFCQYDIEICYRKILDKTAEPSVRLTSVRPHSGRHPAMLMCSVYNFYPKYISVTWLRDGQPVTSDVTSTDELANGDWYYQIHSHLEYTPRSGEKITCMVEHASFPSPKKVDWNPSMSQSDRNKIAIGASGLLLGLILSLAGLIYYKRKARGRVLVPTS
ncbi:H-2 class II histocompatibility antigen, E-S beta chain-like [Lampris incognitus]|uniref:H-2 class II histocompatibility antigen, E-S beta chain-like n=1 Tax=Lampris incognitus TaxID=2546036 RepID=UPI0024B5DBEE|nr:H-2 class II histocompatibility antigen, E-S beta chain-like [Lampris incognitus]